MVTKILALVIIGAALTSYVSARTISMEKDSFEMQKTFFHPFLPPGLGHGISFGGGKKPGFGGGTPGFPSGTGVLGGGPAGLPPGTGVLGGGLGMGFSGRIGSTAGDRLGSSTGDAVVGGGLSGNVAGGQP